jgi:hypothetical protein
MKSKLFRSLIAVGACLFIAYAWYRGYIPVADGPYKARLRHALNLSMLPSSVSITAAGHESWTDYLLFVEVSIEPEQLPELLRGRDFVQFMTGILRNSLLRPRIPGRCASDPCRDAREAPPGLLAEPRSTLS